MIDCACLEGAGQVCCCPTQTVKSPVLQRLQGINRQHYAVINNQSPHLNNMIQTQLTNTSTTDSKVQQTEVQCK